MHVHIEKCSVPLVGKNTNRNCNMLSFFQMILTGENENTEPLRHLDSCVLLMGMQNGQSLGKTAQPVTQKTKGTLTLLFRIAIPLCRIAIPRLCKSIENICIHRQTNLQILVYIDFIHNLTEQQLQANQMSVE